MIGIEPDAEQPRPYKRSRSIPTRHISPIRRESLIALACLMECPYCYLCSIAALDGNQLRPWPRFQLQPRRAVFSAAYDYDWPPDQFSGDISGYIRKADLTLHEVLHERGLAQTLHS